MSLYNEEGTCDEVPMRERQALLGTTRQRGRIQAVDGMRKVEQCHYESIAYGTCRDGDLDRAILTQKRNITKRWTVGLSMLSGCIVIVSFLGMTLRTREQNAPTSSSASSASLRSPTGTVSSPIMQDSVVSAPLPLDDRILERWEEWKVPSEDIHSGRVWKESLPSLYHVWQDLMTEERHTNSEGKRRLQASDPGPTTTTTVATPASPSVTTQQTTTTIAAPSPPVTTKQTTTTTAAPPSPVTTPQTTGAPPVPTTTSTAKPPRPAHVPRTAKPAAVTSPETPTVLDGEATIAPVPAPTPKNHPIKKRTHAPHAESTAAPSAGTVEGKLQAGEETAEEWVKHTWQKVEDGAEDAWNKAQDEEHTIAAKFQGNRTSRGGNTTTSSWVQKEKDWYHSFVDTLRHLGNDMRSWWFHAENATENESRQVGQWWNHTEHVVAEDERAVQNKFKDWWANASTAEKMWWRGTSETFRHFTHEMEEKEKLWWLITRDTAERDWSAVLREEENLWNETVHWEHNFVNETERLGEEAWNSSSNAAANAWFKTVEEEQRMWHAIQHWYKAHATYQEELKMPLEYFNSTAAFSKLMNNYGWFDSSQDFFHLQNGWDAQINQAYCPVATASAILNSIPGDAITLPVDPDYSPYPYATQNDILDSICVQKTVIHRSDAYDGLFHVPGGLTLEQTHNLLRCHLDVNYFDIQTVHVDPRQYTLDEVRKQIRLALMDPLSRVMINYDRRALGQVGAGHFSPVGGYAEREDSFLIMDVAKYKYPPVWVPAARLYASMATVDKCGNWDFPRGQDSFSSDEEKDAMVNKTVYEALLKRINCKETHRGYIIVRVRQ